MSLDESAVLFTIRESYNVDKILDKRTENDQVTYLCKKHGTEDETTWETVANIEVTDAGKKAIINYEAEMKQKSDETEIPEKIKAIQEDNRPRGFDRGLEAEKIVGATDATGELMFLMMFKGCDEADLVPSKQANVKCPQVVIDFYQSKIPWCKTKVDES